MVFNGALSRNEKNLCQKLLCWLFQVVYSQESGHKACIFCCPWQKMPFCPSWAKVRPRTHPHGWILLLDFVIRQGCLNYCCTHSHTHKPTHTHTNRHTHTHINTYIPHTHTHRKTHWYIGTHKPTHTHRHTLPHRHTQAHTNPYTHRHTLPHRHTQTHTHTDTQTHTSAEKHTKTPALGSKISSVLHQSASLFTPFKACLTL